MYCRLIYLSLVGTSYLVLTCLALSESRQSREDTRTRADLLNLIAHCAILRYVTAVDDFMGTLGLRTSASEVLSPVVKLGDDDDGKKT